MLQKKTQKLMKKEKTRKKNSITAKPPGIKSRAMRGELALAIANRKTPKKLIFTRHKPPHTCVV
jgi:glucosamine 6-phosphate synthetase-like amidotransferase/phosphosugar isomerase protein